MAKFEEIAITFRNASNNLQSRLRSVLMKEAHALRKDLVERSPYDTGEFADKWQVYPKKYSVSGSSVVIKNDTPYAYFMEYGAEPNRAPWYYPQRDKKGRFKVGTGKLKISGGRVWAGGLSPGHSKTIGGAIGPVLTKNQNRLNVLTEGLAKGVIAELRK